MLNIVPCELNVACPVDIENVVFSPIFSTRNLGNNHPRLASDARSPGTSGSSLVLGSSSGFLAAAGNSPLGFNWDIKRRSTRCCCACFYNTDVTAPYPMLSTCEESASLRGVFVFRLRSRGVLALVVWWACFTSWFACAWSVDYGCKDDRISRGPRVVWQFQTPGFLSTVKKG
jgi:hypothetical protein